MSFASLILFARRYPTLVVVAGHLLLLAALTSALYAFGIIRYLPGNDNLMHLDVYWYDKIRREGYSYSTTTTSSVAFFPLLPYLWRATRLSMAGMSVLNFSLFLAAYAWLAHQLRLAPRLSLLLLSTPVLVFMAIPYTEALFFVFGTCLLLGLHRGRMGWWVIGLFGCGLTRTASIMFVPVLVFVVVLWAAQPGQARRALRWGGAGLLAIGAAVAIVAYMQWKQVGDPLAFTKVQKFWNNHLRWPDYPFVTPAGIDMLWLDALALCLGCGALGVCGWLAWRWLQQRRRPPPPAAAGAAHGAVCGGLLCAAGRVHRLAPGRQHLEPESLYAGQPVFRGAGVVPEHAAGLARALLRVPAAARAGGVAAVWGFHAGVR